MRIIVRLESLEWGKHVSLKNSKTQSFLETNFLLFQTGVLSGIKEMKEKRPFQKVRAKIHKV